MAEDSPSGGRSRALAWTAALVIVLPLLYVLSTGPVLWLFEKTGLGHSAWAARFFVIYEPLKWLYFHNDFFRTFLEAYLNLFGVR